MNRDDILNQWCGVCCINIWLYLLLLVLGECLLKQTVKALQLYVTLAEGEGIAWNGMDWYLYYWYWVKSVQIQSFFWYEYRKIWTRKNSVFGHFSRNVNNKTSEKYERILVTYSWTGNGSLLVHCNLNFQENRKRLRETYYSMTHQKTSDVVSNPTTTQKNEVFH